MRKVLLLTLALILASTTPAFSQPPTIIERARLSTVKIEVPTGVGDEQVYFCTGVIVGIIRVVAADHCVPPDYHTILVNGVPGSKVVKRKVDRAAYDGLILLDVPSGLGPIIKIAPREPKVGDLVTTLGYVDTGGNYVALRRSVASYGIPPTDKIMALDGTLVKGMSGGPVINEQGELVGINQSVAGGLGLTTRLKAIREFLK